MRKRISMPDRDFMKAAKSAAKSGQSLRATALGAGVSLPNLQKSSDGCSDAIAGSLQIFQKADELG